MIWNVYADNKDLKAKLDAANLEIKKRRANEDKADKKSMKRCRAIEREACVLDRIWKAIKVLQDRNADLKRAALMREAQLTAEIERLREQNRLLAMDKIELRGRLAALEGGA